MRDREYRIVVYSQGSSLWCAVVEYETEEALLLDRGTPHVHWGVIREVWQTSRDLAIRDADKIIDECRLGHRKAQEFLALRLATTEVIPR